MPETPRPRAKARSAGRAPAPLRRPSGLAGSIGAVCRFTVVGIAALVASCALPPERERIVEVATGRELTRAEMLAAVRASDYALLGELHDNPTHHARRGELLAELGAATVVAAEHLPRGQQVRFDGDLRSSLVRAGFDPKGWGWPVHEPLFAGVARSGAALVGANAPRELARAVARDGEASVPAEQRALLDAAPLPAAARAALEDDLVRGHCGQLAGARLANMVWAQRMRDATMWLVLREARAASAQGSGGHAPVVLLAGNGHVRLDYGVAQFASPARPAPRIVSVGMVESGAAPDGAPYTHLWITRRAARGDPCRDMPPIAPARATPVAAGP